jgi:1-acyl-sn-glycerol-3-phosphate acyltransferase
MSPQKPKRPSARPKQHGVEPGPSGATPPAARRSQSDLPPRGQPSEGRVEIPKAAPLPDAPLPARIEKKKLRVSARRGPAPAGTEPTPAAPKPRAALTMPATPRRVRGEAKPSAPAPRVAPQPVAEKPAVEETVEPKPHASTNGASTHVSPERLDAELGRATADLGEYADDDIWNEADTGPSVHLYAARPEAPPRAVAGVRSEPPAAPSEADAEPAPVSRLARSRREGARDEAVMLGSAQTLVSTDYYFRQYGAHGMRSLSAEVDEFGLDPHVEERARPWLEGLCKRYFRVDVDGVQNLPADGRVLMVCNRAGALPWDGLVLRTAVRMARPELQPVRWLAEDSVFHYPFLGVFMNRLGAVRACPENAERLLKKDRLVAVFPEGAHGSSKLFKDRYRLQRFGRGGYVKLALKLGAPIVPTAIIGSEETNPVLLRSRWLGKMLGGESLPITPTFPWLGAAGLLPAPVKWRLVIGEPIDLSSYGPKSADEALLVHRLNEQIRGILQQLVEQALGTRRNVLFG